MVKWASLSNMSAPFSRTHYYYTANATSQVHSYVSVNGWYCDNQDWVRVASKFVRERIEKDGVRYVVPTVP